MAGNEYTYHLKRPLGHSLTPHEGRPARPRDAASLILVRRTAAGPEVLMGKRHRKAAFIPDAYVFPGGGVDPSDALARPATPLDSRVTARLAVNNSQPRARSLAMTAVRETFEEAGLMLGKPGDPATDFAAERDSKGAASWAEIGSLGLAPDLARLTYLGRAITSPYSPIRFHARFFVAEEEHLNGTLGGSGELSDLHWVALGDAAKLPIVDVTEFMLEEVGRLLAGEPRHGDKKPLFAYRENVPFVRYL